ncbi:histone-lysine N-methyltransferase KMT5C, partial [Columba livia]|uniref:histone-lysine N-methyltransferase KMT5C n=1 Tax=Columba livia TaxID=8932 RepID=UPI0031BA64D3
MGGGGGRERGGGAGRCGTGRGSRFRSPGAGPRFPMASRRVTARELCENDDLATSLVLDSVLGFRTHKMGVSPLPALRRRHQLRAAVERFRRRRDPEAAWRALSAAWAGTYFRQRRALQRRELKSHVLRYLRLLGGG